MKVVINDCYGGFGLSDEALERLIELGIPLLEYQKEGMPEIYIHKMNDERYKWLMGAYLIEGIGYDSGRDHPLLIQVVEELGAKAASGKHAKLKIVEIPDGTDYVIEEYDGAEWVAERHETWR